MISYRYLIRAVEQYSLRSNQILLTTEILFYFLNQPNGPNSNKCGTKSDFKRTSIDVWSRLEASDTEPIYVIALQTGTNLPIHKRSINIFYKRINSLVVCKLINKKTYFLKIFKKIDAFNNGLEIFSFSFIQFASFVLSKVPSKIDQNYRIARPTKKCIDYIHQTTKPK